MNKLFYDGHKVYYDSKGYAVIWLDGRDQKVHVLEWERHNGPKPSGHEIHHRDRNKSNFELSNLELLTHSDHQKVHAGWIRDGMEWTAKPCTTCGKVLPLADFYPRKGYTPSANCRECHCLKTLAWGQANRDKRRAIGLAYYYRKKAMNA